MRCTGYAAAELVHLAVASLALGHMPADWGLWQRAEAGSLDKC